MCGLHIGGVHVCVCGVYTYVCEMCECGMIWRVHVWCVNNVGVHGGARCVHGCLCVGQHSKLGMEVLRVHC